MTLRRCYDVRKLTANAILFREIQCKKTDISMFKQRFQCEFGWNNVKYARIMIAHVCFMTLTLPGFPAYQPRVQTAFLGLGKC